MRLILNNLFYFFSPLEQFEINSFNTTLNFTISASIESLEFNYFLTKSLYSFLDFIFIFGILFIIQTYFKQKNFIYLFIFINILLVGFNWLSFTDYIYSQVEFQKNYDFFFHEKDLQIEKLIYFCLDLSLINTTYYYLTIITSFTNIYTVIFCFFFTFFIIYLIYNKMISNNTNSIIPTLYQIIAESLYKLSLNLFYSILGKYITIPEFFIKINTIFIFLIISNVQGMIPYMSTLTSALTNTFFIALALFLSILTTLFDKKGINYFLKLFMPSGCPILLSLLIIPIELISYSFRLVSLSVRLFANMMAGHTLLKVIVGFSWIIIFLGNTWLINIFPILILFILTLLEFGVAIIQAYIFTVLSCIYLRDIFEGH